MVAAALSAGQSVHLVPGRSGLARAAQDHHLGSHVWRGGRPARQRLGPQPLQSGRPGLSARTANSSCSWGEGLIGTGHQLKFDRQGNVWVADVGRHVVLQFTPKGQLLRTLGTPRRAGLRRTALQQAHRPGRHARGRSLRLRRLRQRPRGPLRSGGEVRQGLGQAGHRPGRVQPAARHRLGLAGAALRGRSQQRADPGLRPGRQVPRPMAEHHRALRVLHDQGRRALGLRLFPHALAARKTTCWATLPKTSSS